MTASYGVNNDYSNDLELLKRVYANRVEKFVPDIDKIAKKVPFKKDKKLGRVYIQPVILGRSMGYTFWNDGTVKDLNRPLAQPEISAEISGVEHANRAFISYKFLQTAREALGSGDSAGKEAYVNATKHVFEQLTIGTSFARECQLLYGGGTSPGTGFEGLGTVLNTTGSSGTSLVVQMSAAQWSTAIWAGAKGGEFDIHSTAGTKRNSAGTASTGDTVYRVSSIDAANYKVTFTSHATNVSNVVATDVITFAGSRAADMVGYVTACQTQSGTLWNISTSGYELWRPRYKNVNGALTFEKVQQLMTDLAEIAFSGDLDLFCSPAGYQDLCNDQTALVTHASRTSGKVTIGFDEVTYSSHVGNVHIHCHPYMKRGYALALPRDLAFRVGSTDITHTQPGYGKMFRELEDKAGVEMRHYYDQAAFCSAAGYMGLLYGITNTTDV